MDVVGQIGHYYRSLCGAGVGEGNLRVFEQTQGRLDFIGPFDENDGLGGAEIIEADGFEVGGSVEAIGIDMVNIESAFVFVHKDEGGAGDSAGAVLGAEACGHTLYKVGLAAA